MLLWCTMHVIVHVSVQNGVTALYLACTHGNYEVMKLLVTAFADVNAVTNVSVTAETCESVAFLKVRIHYMYMYMHVYMYMYVHKCTYVHVYV